MTTPTPIVPWAVGQTYATGATTFSQGNFYQCASGGLVSARPAPNGFGASTDGGGNVWTFLEAVSGAWGTGTYGFGPWGGVSSIVSLANAAAIGATLVRVTLNGSPQTVSSTTPGDALNPNSWSVTNLSTGQLLPVIGVAPVSTGVFDLALLVALGDCHTEHELDASGVNSAGGVPCWPPQTFTFFGVLASRQINQETGPTWMRPPVQDFKNDQVSLSAQNPAGTLVIGPNGDYFNVSGNALTRKLILRRFTTKPGGFFHLPAYGAGLQSKALIRVSDIRQLQTKLNQQAAMEPTVVSSNLTVTVDPAAQVLYVSGAVQTTSGQQLQFQQTPLGGATVQL